MRRPQGVSLVELIMVLAIMAILVTAALPSYFKLIENQERVQLVNQMMGALHYARSKAVNERRIVAVCSGVVQCESESIWRAHIMVFTDHDAMGQLAPEQVADFKNEIPQGYAWHWKSFRRQPYLQFNANGTTRALNGTLLLCFDEHPVHSIVISLSGRARSESPSRNAHCT